MAGNSGFTRRRIERMAICRLCDKLRKDLPFCEECGCFMPLKTSLKNTVCPLGKWGTDNES